MSLLRQLQPAEAAVFVLNGRVIDVRTVIVVVNATAPAARLHGVSNGFTVSSHAGGI